MTVKKKFAPILLAVQLCVVWKELIAERLVKVQDTLCDKTPTSFCFKKNFSTALIVLAAVRCTINFLLIFSQLESIKIKSSCIRRKIKCVSYYHFENIIP